MLVNISATHITKPKPYPNEEEATRDAETIYMLVRGVVAVWQSAFCVWWRRVGEGVWAYI